MATTYWEIKTFQLSDGVTIDKRILNGVDTATSKVVIQEVSSCTVEPWGDCKELDFIGRNDYLGLVAGMPVQFNQGNNHIFWGTASIYPPTTSSGAGPADDNADALEKFVVLGGRHLMEKSIIGNIVFPEDFYDLGSQMYQLGIMYGHPFLTFDLSNFPDAGIKTSLLAAPQQTLAAAYDAIVKQVTGGTGVWGVDSTGAVFFKVLT